MNGFIGRLILCFSLFFINLGAVQAAERLFIAFKDPLIFSRIHAQAVLSREATLASLRGPDGRAIFPNVNLRIEDSLKYLDALVVMTAGNGIERDQIALIQTSPYVSFVEEEVIRPLPYPIMSHMALQFAGFRPMQMWGVQFTAPLAPSQPSSPALRRVTNGVGRPWGIDAVQAPMAWSLAGKGGHSRVLVLDSGVDRNHPAISKNFEKGEDFTGGGKPGDVTDSVGHGTHVAGTIAGSELPDGFSGVAPEARILAGRVCVPQGCSNISVARGINWGIGERVDVINMSLGGPTWTQAEKLAVERAAAADSVVVAATGNGGGNTIGFPAAFPDAIAVGAVDAKGQRAKFSQYGSQIAVVAPGVKVASSVPVGSALELAVSVLNGANQQLIPSTPLAGTAIWRGVIDRELVDCGEGGEGEFPAEVNGKFALVRRGTNTFVDKARNAVAAKAAGIVIVNTSPGLVQGTVSTDGLPIAIPAIMIEQRVGTQLYSLLARRSQVKIVLETLASDYAAFDGTSMATPHVAGVVALMRSARKTLRPGQIREILKETATPAGPQLEYGAGIVNAEAAVRRALQH